MLYLLDMLSSLLYRLTDVEDFLNDIITRIDEDKLSACMQQKDVASLIIEYFKVKIISL